MVGITGASGFVGQNLVAYLETSGISQLAITRQELQDGDFTKIDNANSLIHLAGKAHDLKSVSNPEDYIKINFELTKKLYDAFLQSSCTKFIFISSVKAVADHLDNVLTEEFVPNPKTPYGVSKLMAEKYIQAQPLPEGKSYYILRPCMIHGPGNKGNLNMLYKMISARIPYPLAAFKNKRSFLSVKNLCFIIKELVERSDMETGVYNVSDDDPLSTNEVVQILANSLNRKALVLKLPKKVIFKLFKVLDKFEAPLNSYHLEKLTESFEVSNAKIKNMLNKELPLNSKQGIAVTAISFQKRKSIVSLYFLLIRRALQNLMTYHLLLF